MCPKPGLRRAPRWYPWRGGVGAGTDKHLTLYVLLANEVKWMLSAQTTNKLLCQNFQVLGTKILVTPNWIRAGSGPCPLSLTLAIGAAACITTISFYLSSNPGCWEGVFLLSGISPHLKTEDPEPRLKTNQLLTVDGADTTVIKTTQS